MGRATAERVASKGATVVLGADARTSVRRSCTASGRGRAGNDVVYRDAPRRLAPKSARGVPHHRAHPGTPDHAADRRAPTSATANLERDGTARAAGRGRAAGLAENEAGHPGTLLAQDSGCSRTSAPRTLSARSVFCCATDQERAGRDQGERVTTPRVLHTNRCRCGDRLRRDGRSDAGRLASQLSPRTACRRSRAPSAPASRTPNPPDELRHRRDGEPGCVRSSQMIGQVAVRVLVSHEHRGRAIHRLRLGPSAGVNDQR